MAVAVFMVFGAFVVEASAQTAKEYANIINLAGRQRMLTQKMSKEMCLIALGVNAAENRSELKKTADLFDKTHKGLIKGSAELGLPPTTNEGTLTVMKRVGDQWVAFKAIVDGVVGGGAVSVDRVASLNGPLLEDMNTAVRIYEKDAKTAAGLDAGVVINLAGKQRMLSQKLSKEILLVALKHDAAGNVANLKQTVALFDRTMRGLKSGDDDLKLPATKDQAIVAQLDKAQAVWANLKPVAEKVMNGAASGVSNDDVKKVAELSVQLLQEMNKAVQMYQAAQK
jgi:hypothetical protein